MRHLSILGFLALAACGDDGGSPGIDAKVIDARVVDGAVDAPIDMPTIDAPVTVMAVTCPGGNPPTVVTVSHSFSPMTTNIAVNDIVRFDMTNNLGAHSVVPSDTMPTDPGLLAGFNVVTCLRFTVAGTFTYQCNPHGFIGSVVVQ